MAIDLVKELTDLRRMILTMAGAVEERLNRAIDALVDGDLDAAMIVRTGDKEIDRMEVEIEQECLRIFALSHPVASDLRFVLAVMRINTNLERIADMAKSVAKRMIDVLQAHPVPLPPSLATMAVETRRMFADSMIALADRNPDLARRIRAADDRIDDLQKEIFVWAQREIPAHVERTEGVIDLLSIARKLERVADVCTNIAEDVIFLTEGAIIRHGHVHPAATG
jgi:phosphate transport system protein